MGARSHTGFLGSFLNKAGTELSYSICSSLFFVVGEWSVCLYILCKYHLSSLTLFNVSVFLTKSREVVADPSKGRSWTHFPFIFFDGKSCTFEFFFFSQFWSWFFVSVLSFQRGEGALTLRLPQLFQLLGWRLHSEVGLLL